MSDLHQRLITGVIGAAVLMAILYTGGIVLQLSIFFITVIMLWELKNALAHLDVHLNFNILLITSVLMMMGLLFHVDLKFPLLTGAMISLLSFVFHDRFRLDELAYTFFAIVYLPYFVFQISYLDGTPYLYLIFIIAFSTDTFAYFVGSAIGKTKYVPKISPNKSLEGAIGGVIGCLICSYFYLKFMNLPIAIGSLPLIAFASFCAQMGDLLASKIKRSSGIKDFGKILPGHGGFLDRLDSIIPVIPLVYALYTFTHIF